MNNVEWPRYVAALPSQDSDPWGTVGQSDYGLLTDITSFFASIDISRMTDKVYESSGSNAPSKIIARILDAHQSLSERSGLPQRSFASAILANAYLAPVDDAISSALAEGKGVTAARRWMDDISIDGTESDLFDLYQVIQRRLRTLGLEVNTSKSTLGPLSEAAQSLRIEDIKEVDVQIRLISTSMYLDSVEPVADTDTLLEMEDQILRHPQAAQRPTIRAVLTTLEKYEIFDRVPDWARVARNLPHASDSIASYFGRSKDWGKKKDPEQSRMWLWFEDYLNSPWGRQRWVVSNYAHIFRSDPAHTRKISPILLDWLKSSDDATQVGAAVSILQQENAVTVRELVTARLDHTTDPIMRRLLILALLNFDGDRTIARTALDRDPRNLITKIYLEARNWRPTELHRGES